MPLCWFTYREAAGGPAWGGALTNHLQALFGVLGIDVVQLLLEFYDLLCLNGDVCSLALGEHPKREKVATSVSHSRGGWRWVLGAPSELQTTSAQAGGTGLCESLHILLPPDHHQEGSLH